jgi:hypothetical protein
MERRPRAADDFAAIRARMEELKRERERAKRAERSKDEERLDEKRWQISDRLRAKFNPRRNEAPV